MMLRTGVLMSTIRTGVRYVKPLRRLTLVGRCLRALAEVESAPVRMPDQPGAGDRLLPEPLSHRVDRAGDPLGPVGGVEEGQLLDSGQVDGGQPDQPHR